MAEPTFEEVESWLLNNSDKEGTPDYVTMASLYRATDPKKPAAAPVTTPTTGGGESLWDRVKLGFGMPAPAPPPGTPEPAAIDLSDIMTAKRLTSDPRSIGNRADRVMAGAIGGIPDLGIAVYNAGARMTGSPESQADYLTPKMLNNAGVPALPADAPWYERLGEAAGSAFLGGGAGAAGSVLQNARTAAATAGTAVPRFSTNARMAAPTVVPTVAGEYGGELGAALGRNYLGDEETGRLLGSLLGGGSFAAAPAARSLVHQWYAPQAGSNAPAVAAAARNQGVTPTAGMLGNDNILRREQIYSGMPGSADVVQNARTTARAQIGDAYNQAAEARGSVDIDPTAGTIGEKVNVAARESAERLRGESDARQVALQDRIGADTPVNVSPIFERGYGMMSDAAANLTPSARRAIDYRLTNELMPLVNRNAAGDPIPPGVGHNGGPPLAGETARYGDVRGFRTELGQAIDTPAGGRSPPVSALYEPTTTVMRDTATGQGVSPLDFNTVQNRTRAVERTTPATPGGPIGDYPTLQRYINEDPAKAFNYLETGRQNPNVPGLLEATGHPLLGEIFGDLIRKIGNATINHPQAGARGPANLDNAWSRMHPESRDTILGDQAGNVGDTVALARALNVSTSQGGLTRAVGGQTDAAMNKVIGSESAGQFGNWLTGSPIGGVIGRILGVFGPSGYRGMKAGVMEGPTAINALSGGASPGGINQLAAALAAIQASQQQHGTPEAP